MGYSQSMRTHRSDLALMHLFFLDSSVGKESASVQEILVRILGWEDLLEKG